MKIINNDGISNEQVNCNGDNGGNELSWGRRSILNNRTRLVHCMI